MILKYANRIVEIECLIPKIQLQESKQKKINNALGHSGPGVLDGEGRADLYVEFHKPDFLCNLTGKKSHRVRSSDHGGHSIPDNLLS
ncbi:hypothetical protein TNCV_3595591 [Trichonephila clavipes]|nr:hypothetical protein TNCV_3595591 [Trichonephila clavipes]